MTEELTLKTVEEAVSGTAAAFRCVTDYQPAGGPGDKIFPPTYEGGKYALERRRIAGEEVQCVLLDSVQSQANRMELALLEAWEVKRISLPVISVDFAGHGLPKVLRITSLEAPHRIADALLRDSLLGKERFRASKAGKRIDYVDIKNATALFEMCPTALVFGLWDSTGPRGGMGAKFARAMVSEMIGLSAEVGVRTSSRIDPASIMKQSGPLYLADDGGWTLDENAAKRDKNKKAVKLGSEGRPSEANHGNVTPSISEGGVTISKAIQTTVLSLPALRRLRFPIDGKIDADRDAKARTTLAALALCAAALMHEQGADLRSRCLLHAVSSLTWELLDQPGVQPRAFSLSSERAVQILTDALGAAKKAGLPWSDNELKLTPSPELVALVKRSQELMAQTSDGQAES